MNAEPDTIRIFVPLTIKRRNGRPRIVPPAVTDADDEHASPKLIRAIARAWSWRRMLETGKAITIQDIAACEKISDRFVGRMLHLAYLSPAVLEQLVLHRRPCALSIKDLIAAAALPWTSQQKIVFDA
jgi:hypothetical protein